MGLWEFSFYRFRYHPLPLPQHGALGVLLLQIQVSSTPPSSTWGSGSSASTDSGITHSPFLNMGLWEFCFYRFMYNPLPLLNGLWESCFYRFKYSSLSLLKHWLWTRSYASTDSTDSLGVLFYSFWYMQPTPLSSTSSSTTYVLFLPRLFRPRYNC
jgi:hypothetical protein